MEKHRKIAVTVGVLFIIATVAYSIGEILLSPISSKSDYLTWAAENENRIHIGIILVLIDCVAVAGIGILLFPVLKAWNETFALAYAGARIIESLLFTINTIAILTLLNVSRDFVMAGGADTAIYGPLAGALKAGADWAFRHGIGLAFSISALILNYVLYYTKLVPRWISAWGFVGAVLVLVNYFLRFAGIQSVEILFLPIALQEMAFAVWLILKGFKMPVVTFESPESTT